MARSRRYRWRNFGKEARTPFKPVLRHPEDDRVLAAMPGTAREVAQRAGLDLSHVGGSLARLSTSGKARRYGKVWKSLSGPVTTLQAPPKTKRWWLTFAAGDRTCEECEETIHREVLFAYRHEPMRIVCQNCTDRLGLVTVPSKRLLERQRKITA